MTVNLFGRDACFERSLERIVGAFGRDSVLSLKPTREGNTIVVAMKHVTVPAAPELARRAENIETRWKLPARKWLRMMRPLTEPPSHETSAQTRAPRTGHAGRAAPASPSCRWSDRSRRRARRRPFPATDLSLGVVTTGKLTWRTVLAWLRDDKILSAEDVDRTARRFAGGNSSQHPLVRIGSAGLTRVGDGKVLDTETLTEWLAKHCKMTYPRIDPLRVDVGRVADVMSINYAERRHALPLSFGLTEVTIATCEPLDVGWVAGDRGAHQAHGQAGHRQPDRDRALHDRVLRARRARCATRPKMGEQSALANFEQLVELGKSNEAARRQRHRRHPGRRLALAIRVRPARLATSTSSRGASAASSASASTA